MHYNHLNQGFVGTGGVPFNGIPTFPQVECGELMKPHQALIASKVYEDMANRKVSVSNFLVQQMANNTFHNELFSTAMQLTSDYVEYLVGAKQIDLNIAIAQAAPLINDSLIHSYIQKTPNIASTCSDIEKARYYRSAQQINSLKTEIRNYLTRGGNMYPQANQYNTPPMGHYPQPMGYMSQPMMGGQPPMGYPQQQPSFTQRVLSRGTPVNQPMGHYPQLGMPPMQPMGYPHQPMGYMPQQQPMNPAIQQMMRQQQMGFAPQQPPAPQLMTQQPAHQPLPMTYGTQPHPQQQYQQQPSVNAAQPYVPDFKPKQPDLTNQQNVNMVNAVNNPMVTPPLQLDRSLIEYENKVRSFAKMVGLPHDTASIELLEEIIIRQYPKNDFIDPKRPYSVRSGRATVVDLPPSGVDVSSLIQKVTDEELRTMAAKSKGDLVKDARGNYVWQKEAGNPATNVNNVNALNISTTTNYSEFTDSKQPYEFARLNAAGKWFVKEEFYNKIPSDKKNGWGFVGCEAFRECYYIVDEEGVIQDVIAHIKKNPSNEEMIVKYEEHDNRRYFEPMLTGDLVNEADVKASTEAFAKAQVQHKVDDLLQKLEEEANIVSEGEVSVISDMTVCLENAVQGELYQDNYLVKGLAAAKMELDNKVETDKNISYRYRHVCLSPTVYSGNDAKELKKLNTLATFSDIVEFINNLEKKDDLIPLATELNLRATYYINNILLAVFNIGRDTFYMQSFVTDILDVVAEMEKMGYGKEFAKYAAKLVHTLLFVYDNNSHLFHEMLYVEKDDVERVTFGMVRDVTTLPIRSKDIVLANENKRAIVTETSHPSLHGLIKETLSSLHPRVSEVVFCTLDNRQMYVYETVKKGVYAIIQNSVVVDSRSTL